ncbi:MAG TPA: M3 family metallopeptidase, partial [Ideonella sp.]|nr:M3 family metallopeptidase [Ideonella sp.]
MTTDNPLLADTDLPPFDAIRPEHVGPAIGSLLADASAALERVTAEDFPADYDALARVLSVATERLGRAWGAVSHLNAVADTPALRAAYGEALPRVTAFYTRMGGDARLYAKVKAIAASARAAELGPARRRVLANRLRDFALSGAELEGQAKRRYAAIQERLAELSQAYSEHVLDATDRFAWYASADELAGVPDDVVQAARAAAAREGKDGHKLTLHFPSYFPVMQYARERALRERMYTAYVTRASELGPRELDNGAVMREIVELRHEEANLLGYRSFAEESLVPKMADTPQQVFDFLRDLARRARPYAERDLDELRRFAKKELGLAELHAWDLPYASEKLKESRYAFSSQAVKEYFTEPRVLAGLFGIVETLFGVSIHQDRAPAWHPDVRFYRIERRGASDAAPRIVGRFYLDLYARPGKRPGAWMDDVRSRWLRPDASEPQTPVAHLVCNFAAPVDGRPALLTHAEVTTLVHEFGHGLHHLLTQVDELGVSGMAGVEWDAVELPSQFMENFCWQWDVVRRLTAHVDSGAPLPRELFDRMLAARNFQAGLATLRQVEFALFDMRLHAEPGSEADIQALIDGVRREVAVVDAPRFNRFQHGFSHIFAG